MLLRAGFQAVLQVAYIAVDQRKKLAITWQHVRKRIFARSAYGVR
jgi:hypothetical protein